jgi:hypothetical protein
LFVAFLFSIPCSTFGHSVGVQGGMRYFKI